MTTVFFALALICSTLYVIGHVHTIVVTVVTKKDANGGKMMYFLFAGAILFWTLLYHFTK